MSDTATLSRVRTIKQAAAYFAGHDPETCLTETALRTLIRQGRIPSSRVGKKYLVDLDAVSQYFAGSTAKSDSRLKKESTVWHIT